MTVLTILVHSKRDGLWHLHETRPGPRGGALMGARIGTLHTKKGLLEWAKLQGYKVKERGR